LQINKAIKSNSKKKYVYAYWPYFDSVAHEFGVESKKADKHFHELDKKFKTFFNRFKNKKTGFIITADHGFIDTPKNKTLMLDNHPELKKCLTMPFCGDARVIYCYVHPYKAKIFEKYVKTRLKKFCFIYKSTDLIKKNFFGLFHANKKLIDRIGDYVLIMKENYVFRDKLPGKKTKIHVGNHSGLSKKEMLVPLILIKT
jgi:predicted AlkP superfamily pyrophosphatase or phosphodiesterase